MIFGEVVCHNEYMDNQFPVYEEKTFPYLTIALILFLVGIVMVGGIWLAAKSVTKSSTTLTTPIAVITNRLTPLPTLTTKSATPSSQTVIFTFPTKKLTFHSPSGWTTTPGPNDTHQIANWWLPDNTLVIDSPDKKASIQNQCPEGGCPDTYGSSVTITDYGANAFTTPQTWYEGKTSKEAISSASSSATPLLVTTGTFATLPVYCVSLSVATPLPSLPTGIPSGIFTGRCYLIWKAHVYAVSATVDKTSRVYKSNLTLTTALLKSIQLIQ